MDAVFFISFYKPNKKDGEDPISHHLGFCIGNLTQPWNEIRKTVYECEEQLERKYGPTSWMGGGPSKRVNVVWYRSYELNDCHHGELMEQWRQAFLRISPGCTVSDVLTLNLNTLASVTDISEDAQTFSRVKQEYEHQEAEQLRQKLTGLVLNTHVPTKRSTAVKKI